MNAMSAREDREGTRAALLARQLPLMVRDLEDLRDRRHPRTRSRPARMPTRRRLSGMSPFRMWLNSCADHALQLVARERLAARLA